MMYKSDGGESWYGDEEIGKYRALVMELFDDNQGKRRSDE